MTPRMPRFAGALLLLALAAAGCGDAERLALRYRAEQVAYRAQKAESEIRLSGTRPDTTALLKVREQYRAIRSVAKAPYIGTGSESSRKVGRELLRLVATGEFQGARLALEAGRPDLALQQSEWLIAHSEGDSMVERQADFLAVGSLRAMGRGDQAVERMRAMLAKYEPLPPPPGTSSEDAILTLPETMAQTRRAMGDDAGVARELDYAVGYYEGLLRTPRDPMLEALIRARLVRTQLERNRAADAIGQVAELEKLVASNPGLKPLEPELRYSRAKIRALTERDRTEAIALLDRFASEYPKHPLALRALFDAAIFLEDAKRYEPALQHYRSIVRLYPENAELAPIALFRQGMLEERMGDWNRAKATLESVPVKYPGSQAAAEAPFMIAKRYNDRGEREAAQAALVRAAGVYRGLIDRDSTSAYAPTYRFNLLRSYLVLGDWDRALGAVDELAVKNRKHPFTAQALLEGARVAAANRQRDRAAGYLQQFLEDYPNSPLAGEVQKQKQKLMQ